MQSERTDFAGLKRRYVGLDLFRIVAIAATCAFHTVIHLGADYGVLQPLVQMGAVFMTAFFMISGYSLFVNYASKNLAEFQNMKPFWRKRFIGIVPLYYVASLLFILFCHVWYTVLGNGTYSVMDELRLAPIEILGLQSVFHSLFSLSHNGGTWFVSCILLCYLVYPLLQEVARQISTKARLVLLCLFAGILLYAPSQTATRSRRSIPIPFSESWSSP